MSSRVILIVLWIGVVAIAVRDLHVFRSVAANVVDADPITRPPWIVDRPMSQDSASTLAALVTDADPFRVDRHPTDVPFRPLQPGPAATAPPPVRPVLTLSGIVGGPPWAAVITGVPGHPESVVVHAGDTVGGLRIRVVTASNLVVSGTDTVWRLRIQHPWR